MTIQESPDYPVGWAGQLSGTPLLIAENGIMGLRLVCFLVPKGKQNPIGNAAGKCLKFWRRKKNEELTLTTAPLGRQLTMCRVPSCLAPTSNTRRVGSANDPLTSVYILS